jgi:hypothetical protein
MVRRESFQNKLRELNYTYKTKQKRTTLWRKVGGTHRTGNDADRFVRTLKQVTGRRVTFERLTGKEAVA